MISVRVLAQSGITVIDTGPRLTSENSPELLKAVESVPMKSIPSVIVNMEKTRFVDSAGVGALVHAMKYVSAVKGNFAVAGLRSEILRSFHLMNLHQVFDMYETEELAREQMNEPRL